MAKKTKTVPAYTISIRLGDSTFSGTGATLYDALVSLKKPVKIITKGFITVTDGEKTVELMYMPARLKRLFAPLAQTVVSKQLEILLNAA